jgi:rhodanese-related sulfurtransferase
VSNLFPIRPLVLEKILSFSLVLLTLASAGAKEPLRGGVREITIEETDRLIREQADVAVIDVRTVAEFSEQGHLPRAQLVDFFREDFAAAVESLKLDPAKPCIVYCAIGGRAQRAAEKMAKLGFKEILLPKGSFKAWKAAGKPIEGGSKQAGS